MDDTKFSPTDNVSLPDDINISPIDDSNVSRIQYMGKEIILIGTAHVSKESAQLVKQVIDAEKPDSVCIELDEARFGNIQNPKAWEETNIINVIKQKKTGFLLANLVLSSYQKKIAKQLDTQVGAEMLQGIESAKENGAQLVLADRDIQTTFLRIWRKLSFWEKAKLAGGLIFSVDEDDADLSEKDIEELLQSDMLESAISSVKEEFPGVSLVLIHERDMYLANKIKNAPGEKIVAVLGGAHVPGVKEEINKEQDMEEINYIPPKGKGGKIAGWIIPVIIVGLIVYSFFVSVQTGFKQLSVWVLWNSGLAALFTAIALGHPLTILTSFVTAPIATLNPLLAVGWFAGIAEATLRKPTVHDLQNVHTDIFSFKGFFKNRVLRILLVVILSSIGGAIGNFIGGIDMVKNLF